MFVATDLKIVKSIFGGDFANCCRVGLIRVFVVHEKVVLRGEVSQQELRDVVLLHSVHHNALYVWRSSPEARLSVLLCPSESGATFASPVGTQFASRVRRSAIMASWI